MPGKRRLSSFIEGFQELVLPKGTPGEFALWTALWCIGAAVERRVWTFTLGEELFPNLFIFLVAPPGFGKGLALEPAHRIVNKLGKNWIGASSMTYASLADGLREGHRTVIDPKTQLVNEFWSLNVLSPELQVLLPEHDTALLGKITYLYDGKEYSESRRGGDGDNTFTLPRVLLSMIGGTTPEHLFSTFPESAFKMGFFSRTIMVWGTRGKDKTDLFSAGEAGEVATREADLLHDLKLMREVWGQFLWDDAAKSAANNFYKEHQPYGGSPVPSHPRLLYYCTRRTQHLVKIMMLRAVDLGTMTLTAEIYDWAYHVLISAEARMPEIFQEHNSGGETSVVNDVHHEMVTLYIKTGKPIPRSIVYQLFGARAQAFKIEALINMATMGGWMTRQNDPKLGTVYIPRTTLPTESEVKMK